MAFIEKYIPKNKKINIVPQEEISLFDNTFRCPNCYLIPAFNLILDLDTLLTVKVKCKCGEKEFEITDFLNKFSKDFKGNIQCNDCKDFATKNNTIFKYCLKCHNFYCGECQYDHAVKEDCTFIPFKDVGSICDKHKNYYQAFCKDCQKDICKHCYPQHAEHKIINYNNLYISDLEMVDFNKNYGNMQLTTLFKDTEIKETVFTMLNDVDDLNKNYIIDLFDANKQKNQNILLFFKAILKLYNTTEHKNYNVIMNVRNNICYNFSSFEIKPDLKMDENILLNKFYLYAKNHCIARKPKPFKEQYEKIDTKSHTDINEEMDDIYKKIVANIQLYLEIINNEKILLNDGVETQIELPYLYENYIYFGEFRKDKITPHGRGILINKNGDKYYGNFQNGKKNKIGMYFFKKNGAKYQGEWEDNKMNGFGKYFYPNGSIYEGYFKQNKKHGFGILITPKRDKYITFWSEGKVKDYGKIIYKDGKIYEGFINNYKKDIFGNIIYPNGDCYSGMFRDDFYNFGIYEYKNGNTYFGYFKNNKMNGYGQFKYANEREYYEGYFFYGKRQGIGRYYYKNGDIYNGYLYDDLRNGFGIINYSNGDWYKGIFVKDARHGVGIYYDKKGDEYYIGEWVEDKREGVATIYNQNFLYSGSIKNGVKEGYCDYFFNGFKYSGYFKDNMWEGFGKIKKGKEIYKGYFKRGKMPKLSQKVKGGKSEKNKK